MLHYLSNIERGFLHRASALSFSNRVERWYSGRAGCIFHPIHLLHWQPATLCVASCLLLPLKRQGWQAYECVQDLNVTEYIVNDYVANAAGLLFTLFVLRSFFMTQARENTFWLLLALIPSIPICNVYRITKALLPFAFKNAKKSQNCHQFCSDCN